MRHCRAAFFGRFLFAVVARRVVGSGQRAPVMVRLCLLRFPLLLIFAAAFAVTSCHTARPLTFMPRKGDEIVVAGQMFHTGTRVVTWMDAGGYDAYRTERRFSAIDESSWEKTKDAVKDMHSP